LASEKIEIQRHYVMVSITRNWVLRNSRFGDSCSWLTRDISQKYCTYHSARCFRIFLLHILSLILSTLICYIYYTNQVSV